MPKFADASAKARRTASGSAAPQGERSEASSNAGRALGAYVAYLAYWVLILVGNSDAEFVFNRAVRLPLFGVAVPLDFYFFSAPLAGLLIFLLLQFHLHSLSGPAESGEPEGRSTASTRRPVWLVASVLGGPEFATRDVGRRILAGLLWASLPATLAYHFLRFLPIHEFAAAYILGGLVIFMTMVVAACWWTRPGRPASRPMLRTWITALAILAALACQAMMVISMTPWAAKGYYSGSLSPLLVRNFLRPFLSVDMNGLDLTSAEPGSGLRARPQRRSFEGIHLEGARLRFMTARDVDFRFARLGAATVDASDFNGANFLMADLAQATFRFSVLAGADLTATRLKGTLFFGCDLRGTSFRYAWFGYGKLDYCQAAGADFRMASFEGMGHAFYTNFEGANLEGISFRHCQVDKSIFARANLKDADFRDSELWKTDFSGANLEGADFSGAIRLEAEQLSRARTLYRAKLDPPLSEKIKKNYPRLFEKPAEPGVR